MTAILTVQNIEKSFGARRVLAGVSFAVHDKDRIGLVGLNGSGKSTLLKLLSGIGTDEDASADGPDAGLLTRRRDLHVEYVSQEPRLPPEHSVQQALRDGLRAHSAVLAELETLGQQIERLDGHKRDAALVQQAALHERLEDLGGWDVEHEIRGLASALQLPPLTAIISTLSIGERRRVALAAALLARPELLLLDEPTNHLDTRTVEWLETRLRTQPGALVLVTHDRYFLDRVATRILELDRGHLYSYDGNYRRFLEKQAERLDNEQSREHDRAMFVRREIDWIRRGPQARATKQKARIDRFYEAVAEKPGIDERSPMDRKMILRLPTGGRIGKTILEMRNLRKSLGGKLLFSDLTLILKPGDRIGIVGGNGAGKTTLVRTLLGEIPPDAGEVITGINTRIAFLDQGRAELDDEKSVLQEVSGDSDTVLLEDGPVHVRSFLRMMLFDDRFADAKVGTLSGGERNRVQLAKLLRRGGNLLVLDEPTNDLDLMTLGVLEQALVEFPGCALVVSHDRWFLDTVATAILAFGGDGQVTFYEGNYTDYLTKAREAEKQAAATVSKQAAQDKAAAAAANKSVARPAAADKSAAGEKSSTADKTSGRRLSFNEQRELGAIEEKILTAENAVKALQEKLNEPTLYRERPAEVPGLVAELEAARTTVERLYARWQELDALPKK